MLLKINGQRLEAIDINHLLTIFSHTGYFKMISNDVNLMRKYD